VAELVVVHTPVQFPFGLGKLPCKVYVLPHTVKLLPALKLILLLYTVIVLLVLQPLPVTVHFILFVPALKPPTVLFALELTPVILPRPVVTIQAPVVPALGALACKFIVVLHTV
jgi:hypothetical protein